MDEILFGSRSTVMDVLLEGKHRRFWKVSSLPKETVVEEDGEEDVQERRSGCAKVRREPHEEKV